MTTADAAHRGGLQVAPVLADFVAREVAPGLGIAPDAFWRGLANIAAATQARGEALLCVRDALQADLDAAFAARADRAAGGGFDAAVHVAHLRRIGYLAAEPPPFAVRTSGVDAALAALAGPQLVVPATIPRYALNAANARWGSLYDALYGTDALEPAPTPGAPYDPARGERVATRARVFLDEVAPLARGSHADIAAYAVGDGALRAALRGGGETGLREPEGFVGHVGEAAAPSAVLLVHHGLHVQIVVDRASPVGAADAAGVSDVRLEAALSVIVDLEDSVATVDAEDKVAAYRTWLGLMRGDLEAPIETGVRRPAPPLGFTGRDGAPGVLPGRAVLMLRTTGLHLVTDAVLDGAGRPLPEHLLDLAVGALAALHDLRRSQAEANSPARSVYVVRPKMHGPDEVAFANEVFSWVEDLLDLPRHTLKMGIMDEERRTSANLAACIAAARDRVVFINTGFLDRSGDEIHTAMRAGPVLRKADIKAAPWFQTYEDRNVAVGLAARLSGRGQIGKGMWAAPDRMAAMLREKGGHPAAGANTAWVPSPTAATLHALHYHAVDAFGAQRALPQPAAGSLERMLTPPLAGEARWTREEVAAELDNNLQGILGYVVRWVDQGVGCSKVPDLSGVALMEDRATLRISSQHVANWLLHGVVSADEVHAALRRMAAVVDAQNAHDPAYRPMAPGFDGEAFRCATDLVFEGASQPNGYTEAPLYLWRRRVKAAGASARPQARAAGRGG